MMACSNIIGCFQKSKSITPFLLKTFHFIPLHPFKQTGYPPTNEAYLKFRLVTHLVGDIFHLPCTLTQNTSINQLQVEILHSLARVNSHV